MMRKSTRAEKLLALAIVLLTPAIKHLLSPTVLHAQSTAIIFFANPGSIPAGTPGLVLQVTGEFPNTQTPFCFYTGFGSAAPIVVATPAGEEATVNVTIPASTIQAIPSASISSDEDFEALLYVQTSPTANCTGTPNNAVTTTLIVPIFAPEVEDSNESPLPVPNPNLTGVPAPRELYLNGFGFIAGHATVTLTGNFTSLTPTATVVDADTIRVNMPRLPATATSLAATVCTTDPSFSYCSNPLTIPLQTLTSNPGTLTASPNPTTPSTTTILSATFGNTSAGVGIPTGLVTFKDGTTTLGTATLSPVSEQFIQAPTSTQINTSTDTPSFVPILADFNKDGLTDVMLVDPVQGSVDILVATDDIGDFADESSPFQTDAKPGKPGVAHAAVSKSTSGFRPKFVIFPNSNFCGSLLSATAADFNGDSYPDIAILCENPAGTGSNVLVYLNAGDGTFNEGDSTAVVTGGTLIAAGDFNKDGKQDIVITAINAAGSRAFETYFGDGTGDFPTSSESVTTSARGTQLLAVDLNNDGYPDLIISEGTPPFPGTSRLATPIGVFQNDQTGKFPSTPTYSRAFGDGKSTALVFTPSQPSSSFPDLLVAIGGTAPGIQTVTNNQTAAIGFSSSANGFGVTNIQSATIGDFNGDGVPDVATYDGTNIKVFPGFGTIAPGTINGTAIPGLTTPATNVELVGSSDPNTDGYSDLLTVSPVVDDVSNAFLQQYITSGTAIASLFDLTFAAGTHNLTATTPGTVTLAGGTATTSLPSNLSAASVFLTPVPASPTTYSPTGNEMLVVDIPASAGPNPTGTVQYFDGTTSLGTQPLTLGSGESSATLTTATPLHAGTHSLTAVYSGDGVYATATSAVSTYVVNKATPTVTWTPAPSTITFGTALVAGELNATATVGGTAVAGTFTYKNASGTVVTTSTVLPAGANVLTVTFVPTDTTDYSTPAGVNATITVNKATPVVAWTPTTPTITFGTALGAGQLNATATNGGTAVPGTFTYRESGVVVTTGTVLPVGANAITVSFVPTDTTDFNTPTAAVGATITVNKATPTDTLTVSPVSPTTYASGANETLTANLVGTTPPTGTVQFFDGATSLGTGTLVVTTNATASITTTTPLTAGTHSLTAVYSGDGNYTTVTSAVTNYVVNQATTVLAWTPATPTITAGTALGAAQLNATAKAGTPAVPGVFTYKNASGTVVTTGTVLPAGANVLTVSFVPTDTTDFSTPAPVNATITVNKINPGITLAVLPATPTTFSPTGNETLTANLTTSSSPLPTGTVQFFDGATSLGTGTVVVATSSTATITTTTPLTAGTHSLTAVYSGDGIYNTITSTATSYTVNKATPVVAWTPATPITYGTGLGAAQLNATAKVGSTAVAGVFTYKNALGTVVTIGTILPPGSNPLTVSFVPTDTTDYNTPTGTVPATIFVNMFDPSVVETTSPTISSTFAPGGSETLTATVTGTGSVLPTGTVTFFDGSTSLGMKTLVAGSGVSTASLTSTSVLTAGTHSLTVSYAGDGNYQSQSSTPVTYTIAKATPLLAWTPAVSSITVGTGLGPAQLNATATVGGATVAGTFTYKTASGTVVTTGSSLPVGANPLTVSFVPTDTTDYNTPTGTAGATITVNTEGSNTTLTVTPASPTTYDPAVTETLNADVTTSGFGATGTVQFFDGSTSLGTQTLTVNSGDSTASLSVGPLTAGTHALTVTYSGDSNNAGSSSSTTNYVVNQVTPVVAWTPATPNIAFGTGLGPAQLNAKATVGSTAVAGTFTYKNASGTVVTTGTMLPIGANPLTVTFVPTDTVDYATPTTPVGATINVMTPTPTITSTNLVSLPAPNPNLSGVAAPTAIDFEGTGFIPGQITATFSGSFASIAGTVSNSSATFARVDVPATLPPTATSVTVTLCNQTPSMGTFCASPVTLPLTALAADPGTLTATPNPTTNVSSTTLKAVFGSAAAGAGIPSGLVTFMDGTTTLGTAPLSFASGQFVAATGKETLPSNNFGFGQPVFSDFHRDGLQDLMLVGDNATVYIYPAANNLGAFGTPIHLQLASPACEEVDGAVAGDFNGDGYPDVAVLCFGNLPSGIGPFTRAQERVEMRSHAAKKAAQFNPDFPGPKELLYVFINKGDGTFAAPQQSYDVPSADLLAVGDFNKDGHLDLAIAGPDGNGEGGSEIGINVYPGDGAGNFNTTVAPIPAPLADGTQMTAVDFNNDGYSDLAILNCNFNGDGGCINGTPVVVFQNDGTGSFSGTPAAQLTFGDGNSTFQFFTRKLPLSQYPDIIGLFSGDQPGFAVALNNKTSTIGFGTPTQTNVTGLNSAAIGDFTGDGYPDLAVFAAGTVSVYNSDTNGQFSTPLASFANTSASSNIDFVLGSTDPNGDGYADLVTYVLPASEGADSVQEFITSGTAKASLPGLTFAPGTHSLTATTPGTGSIAGGTASLTLASNSTTPLVTLTVVPASPTTYSPTGTEMLNADVTIAFGPGITGSVQFFDGSTLLATQTATTVSGGATATVTVGPLHAGTHSLTAVYSGDSNFTTATSAPTTYVVNKATPVVAWTPTTPTIVFGTGLGAGQLNATATIGGTPVAGVFTYMAASGVVTTGTVLPVGTNPLTVSFVPTDTTDYNTPTGTVGANIIVTRANAGIMLAVIPASPTTYSPTTNEMLTASVTVSGTPLATGTVTFFDGEATLGTGTLVAGSGVSTASITTTTPLNAGTHSLTALYTGDVNYSTRGSSVTTYVVNKATPVVAWTPTSPTIVFGTGLGAGQLNATATVGGTPVAGVFTYMAASGVVTTGTVLPVGTNPLTVTFVPTDTTDYNTPTGTVGANIIVTRANAGITLAVIPTSPTTYSPTTNEMLSASVTVSGTPLATGTVQFFDGETLLGTGTLVAGSGVSTASITTTTPLKAGTHSLSALYSGDGNYSTMNSLITTYVVNKATPVVTWTPTTPTIVFGTGLSTAQLNATATVGSTTVAGTFTYMAASGVVTTGSILPVGADALTVTFVPTDTTDYNTPTATVGTTITVNKASSGISLSVTPTSPTTYSPTTEEVLTASVTVPGTPLATGTVQFFDGATSLGTGTLTAGSGVSIASITTTTPLKAGTHLLTAVYSGDGNYGGMTSLATTYVVNKATPVVTWTPTTPTITFGTGLGTGQLNATATVGGTTVAGIFTYTAASGIVTTGSILPVGANPLTVTFVPTDTTDYNTPTATVGTTITVNKSGTVVALTVSPISPATYSPTVNQTLTASVTVSGTPAATGTVQFFDGATSLGTANLTPGSGVSTASITTTTPLKAGTHSLTVVYSGDGNYNSMTSPITTYVINKATPVVAWTPSPTTINFGTALVAGQLNATANVGSTTVAGVFTYTAPSGPVTVGTVLPVGANALSVAFVPTDTADYNTPTAVGATITVNQDATTTSIATSVNPAQFGQQVTFTVGVSSAFTGAAITGSVSVFDGSTLIGTTTTPNGSVSTSTLTAGTHSITAVYNGNTAFATSTSAPLSQTVAGATTTIAWATPASIVYGTKLSATQLNATVSTGFATTVPGTFVYTPPAGTLLTAGTQTLTVTFTPTDTTSFKTATGSVNLVVTPATPTVNWPKPAPIVGGTPLSGTQLNATVLDINGKPLPGVPTYTPPAGTVLAPGATTLNFSFVPTDNVDYTNASASVPLTVNPAVPTIAVTSSANPSQFGQPVTLTVNITSIFTATPISGTVTVFDGSTALGTPTIANGVATVTTSALTAGSHSITASYTGNSTFASVTSQVLTQTVNAATTIITWPQPAGITYGTLLSATQLDATVSTANATTVAGTFVYTPAAGTLLTAGTQTLSVTFTPTDTVNFKPVTSTTTIVVGKFAPVLAWATPASVVAGTVLSSTQLNATAAGFSGTPGLPGVFTYTPGAGTVLTAGQQTLSVTFTPTDLTNYTTATTTVSLDVIAVVLSSVSPNTALLGAPATTITLTGTGFVANSVVNIDGASVTPTFVNGTTLTAVIPASSFTTIHNIPVFVTDPTQSQTTATLNIAVTAPPVTGTLQGPTTITTGQQPSITLQLPTAYPVPITVTYTLSFTPAAGLPNDPTIVFPNGTTTETFTLPANTTVTPAVQFQGGSVAGTITVTVTLSAGGQTLVPTPNILPLVITSPAAVPGIVNVTLTRSSNVLTVAVFGYSNIREIKSVKFHFIPAAGQTLATTDITIDGSTLFPPYFSGAASQAVGSAFEYDQVFNLDQDASVVGQVQVTLINSLGSSQVGTSQ